MEPLIFVADVDGIKRIGVRPRNDLTISRVPKDGIRIIPFSNV